MLDRLKAPNGATTKIKRVGRGEGSGLGKTSGRGHKGQRSRKSGGVRRGFEGGQMPLHRRLPKRGFHNRFRIEYSIVNVGDLAEKFNSGDAVNMETLREKRLIRNIKGLIKILGNGDIQIPLFFKANKFSKMAIKKIEASGGKVEAV